MKYKLFYTSIIILLASVSCEKEEQSRLDTEGKTRFINAVAPEFTKTKSVPGDYVNSVYWTNDDEIAVNGLKSSRTIVDYYDPAIAEFAFNVALPISYCAVSPYSVYDSYNNINETGTIILPEIQYVKGDSFDADAAVMLAYSNEVGEMKFEHAMSYLKLTIEETTTIENIKSVIVSSNGKEAMCGKFSTTFSPDGCFIKSDEIGKNSLTINCLGEGSALGSSIMIAIPPRVYSGLTFVITDDDSEFMKASLNNLSFIAEPGNIYPVSIDFEPGAFSGDIESAQDWNSFAAKSSRGYSFEGETINLLADITIEDLDIAAGEFKGTFVGNGHTITQRANTKPLFKTIGVGACVSELTVDGRFVSLASSAIYGNAAIAQINFGTIRDVTVNCALSLTSHDDTLIGALVAQNGGLIENCINNSDVLLTVHATDLILTCGGGGIAAYGHTIGKINVNSGIPLIDETCKPGRFVNCTNNGSISVSVTGAGVNVSGSKGSIVGLSSYGGICGLVFMDGVLFEKCTNTGSISRISETESSSAGVTAIGGILGSCAGYFTESDWNDRGATICLNTGIGYNVSISGCFNTGQILSKCRHSGSVNNGASGARIDYAGGIIGAAFGNIGSIIKISDSKNSGKVTGGWSQAINTQVLGGIAGGGRYADIKNCEVECELVNIEGAAVGAVGGYVAYVKENITVKHSKAYVTFNISKPNIDLALLWGLVYGNIVNNATISDTQVGGIGLVNGATIELTTDNFTSFICNNASKNAPVISNVTLLTK